MMESDKDTSALSKDFSQSFTVLAAILSVSIYFSEVNNQPKN